MWKLANKILEGLVALEVLNGLIRPVNWDGVYKEFTLQGVMAHT